jgi:hypothetical protein
MMKIKMALAFLLLFVAGATAEPQGIIIGFRGSQEQFDQSAFEDFAKKRNLIPFVASPYYFARVVDKINQHRGYYELYGYSLGAQAVRQVVVHIHQARGHMPARITTVGAHSKTNVNFAPYGIEFDNYFDASGRDNRAPGQHLSVPHDLIMRYVTDNFN